jgi:hypothetical protein
MLLPYKLQSMRRPKRFKTGLSTGKRRANWLRRLIFKRFFQELDAGDEWLPDFSRFQARWQNPFGTGKAVLCEE